MRAAARHSRYARVLKRASGANETQTAGDNVLLELSEKMDVEPDVMFIVSPRTCSGVGWTPLVFQI